MFVQPVLPPASEEELPKTAAALREAGNEHVRAGRLEPGYACYTEALALDPLSAVLYCNRAAAALALRRFREVRMRRVAPLPLTDRLSQAELDCSIALSLDAKLGKALYRRAQARQAQGKLQDALRDAEQLLALAANDAGTTKAAQKLAADIRSALDKPQGPPAPRPVPALVTVVHEEPAPSTPPPPPAPASVAPTTPLPTPALPKVALQVPRTAFELEATLAHLGTDAAALAQYLALLPDAALPALLGNALTEPLLRCFWLGLAHASFEPAKGAALLQAVLRVPRAEMVVLFLADDLKAQFGELFARWKGRGFEVPAALSAFSS